MSQAKIFWNRDFDIRTRVVTLICVLLIPLLAVTAWLGFSYADAERRVIEAKRYDAVNNISYLMDREIAQVKGALISVASSPDLISGDFDSFRRQAERFTDLPQINSLAIYKQGGQQVFLSHLSAAHPLSGRIPATHIAAVFNGETVVSDVSAGTTPELGEITVSVPVYRDGKVVFALSSGILTNYFAPLFAKADLGGKWVAAVVDRNGLFVARSLNNSIYIGKPARPELLAAARGAPDSGTFANVTLEGTPMTNSFRRSELTGWTSVVAVPTLELNAPLRMTQFWILVGGLTVSLTSLGIAWRMATRIAEPVRQLSEVSTALVEGRSLPDFSHKITELTEVRAAFEHAGAKLAHLAAIVASSGDAILSVGLDGKVLSWNPGAERLFGYTAEEMIGQPKSLIIPDELVDGAMAQLAVARGGDRVRTETQRLHKDGTRIDVSLDLAPIGDKNGAIIGMSTIAHDITEKKSTEQHQHFLMRELTHRSKNLLAVINAMARQTVRSSDSLDDFEKRFSSRIQGLAASHDLLVSQNWAAASLRDLVSKQIQVFSDEVDSRLDVSGPDVYVGVEAAQTLGLALHELATNSVKYGALSRPCGKIIVQWGFDSMNDKRRGLRISWEERGGPPVANPTRTGFGHVVIERMVAQSLDGDVSMTYAATGLIWVFKFPATHLIDRTTSGRPAAAKSR